MEGKEVTAPGSTIAGRKWDKDPVSGDELENLNLTLSPVPAGEPTFSAHLHNLLDDLDVLADVDDGSGPPREPRGAADWPLILAPNRSRSARSRRRARHRMALTPQVAQILLVIMLFAGLGTISASVVFHEELSRALDQWDRIFFAAR
ncbi:MAG: hypothetical protein WBD07_07980 [Vicinamibacterales bacterium]